MMISKHPKVVEIKRLDLELAKEALKMYAKTKDERFKDMALEAMNRAKYTKDNMKELSESYHHVDSSLNRGGTL